jgi:hypothetical protein
MTDKEEKNEQNFVGGSMAGLPATSTPSSTPTPSKNGGSSSRVFRVRDRGGVVPSIGVVRTERDKREPINPMSTVLMTDMMGRPVELHPKGFLWEAGTGIERRFKVGDELWLIMRTTLRDEYITKNNSPEFLASIIPGLPSAPVSSKIGAVPFLEPFTHRVRVVEHQPGHTITVGLCPLYAVQVVDGPAQGLRFLAFPSDLMDDDNLDGFGVDRILRRQKERLDIPKGFAVKGAGV